MIRLLHEADREAMIALLNQAPYLNLYLLGNLESMGFDRDYCEFWGDFSGPVLRAVLNRYMQGWTLFGDSSADWGGLAVVIDNHAIEAQRLQDNPGGIPSIIPYLRCYDVPKVSEEQLMDLGRDDFRPVPASDQFCVRRATLDDLPALVEFYGDAGSMSRSAGGVDRPLRERRVWIARQEDRLVSAALTNAETRELAMIGGVYTPPLWRGRGFSQAVCSALCADLLAAGKRPVLYWENETARKIYEKLGFRRRGVWRSVWLQRREDGASAK